jgi:hypothetical protein
MTDQPGRALSSICYGGIVTVTGESVTFHPDAVFAQAALGPRVEVPGQQGYFEAPHSAATDPLHVYHFIAARMRENQP